MAKETEKEKQKRKSDELAKSKGSVANVLMKDRKKKKAQLEAIMNSMK